MNVLSLFDGMSCGQIALERSNIKVDKYYSSEVDKYAIKVTNYNYKNTIQIGDVRNVNVSMFKEIDLLIGGSPCKGFSNAGNGLNFDHPESKLFFEYVRILKELKPKYFLLENVKMKKEWENTITKILGVRPLRLNSSLVSAQVRKRLYWTNIPVTSVPIDKRIYLQDILDGGSTNLKKSYTIDANYFKGGSKKRNPINQSERRNMVMQLSNNKESGGKQPYQQNRIYDIYGKSTALMSVSLVGVPNIITHSSQPRSGKGNGGKGPLKKQDGKSYALDTSNSTIIEINETFRKLSVKECCRLQTVPDTYFDGIVSNTQAYKMLGNGWTIDIISHIFNHLPEKYKIQK